jgi:ABC-type multidrug transport system fused ATPase/permease subunit
MLYDKNLRVSPATNKSISQGKFLNIVNTDCSCHWGCFWMGAEILKATLVLFMCTYSLYLKVGYACFLTFVFIGAKVSIDLLTRKWRESTWKKVGKASDERASEINEAFKNAKTLKLYSWESIFVDRIKAKRSRQERLIYKGELKNLLNHMFHSLFGQMMRPTIIACALYLGRELDLSTTLATIMMIDWIAWPLHMLPNFMHNIRETKRAMRRIQKVLMLDEIQEGAKEVSAEPQWSKPALEIKGNFTWGFINKAED